jgi:hypothetical protein
MRPLCHHLLAHLPNILAKEKEIWRKREVTNEKKNCSMHARLCGGGNLLKALGSVASYLADRLFNLSNDTPFGSRKQLADWGLGILIPPCSENQSQERKIPVLGSRRGTCENNLPIGLIIWYIFDEF